MFSQSPLKSHHDSKAAKKLLELQKNLLLEFPSIQCIAVTWSQRDLIHFVIVTDFAVDISRCKR